MRVCKSFRFDSAHLLPGYDGPCSRLHGHTFRLDVECSSPGLSNGFVIDFAILKKIVTEEVISQIDHEYLNNMVVFPSSENMLWWIYDRLKYRIGEQGVELSRLRLYETPDSYAEEVF